MKVVLQNVRLAFPDLFDAREFEPGDGKPRFSANFIVEKGSENHKRIAAAINQVASETWKAKAPNVLEGMKGNGNKFCYTSGDTKNWSGAEGMMVLASHRKESDGRPSVVNRDLSPLLPKDGKIYSGCRVNASVDIWAQEGTNSGIRCTLIGVQFYQDDQSFSGAPQASADDFEALETPTGGSVDDDFGTAAPGGNTAYDDFG